jgi:hypothetical protein
VKSILAVAGVAFACACAASPAKGSDLTRSPREDAVSKSMTTHSAVRGMSRSKWLLLRTLRALITERLVEVRVEPGQRPVIAGARQAYRPATQPESKAHPSSRLGPEALRAYLCLA